MNKPSKITIDLLSDTIFSRGEGTAGLVDIEVEHDKYGLPYLGGKTLHGILRDSWLSLEQCFPELSRAAERIYGPPGDLVETSILRIGDAVLDQTVREWILWGLERKNSLLSPADILAALTNIRYQTSEDRQTGAPAVTALRSVRVILRGLQFESPITWLVERPTRDDLQCLAMGVLATRHAGLAANRGHGWLRLVLDGDSDRTRVLAKRGVSGGD